MLRAPAVHPGTRFTELIPARNILKIASGWPLEGDAVELWAYNEKSFTNSFATIPWSEPARESAARDLGNFIREQQYHGTARYGNLSADLDALLATRPNMFVFLLTDAHTPIKGLPFDVELNTEFGLIRGELRLRNSPGLAVLRVDQGRASDWRVFAESPVPDVPPQPQPAIPAKVADSLPSQPALPDVVEAVPPESPPEPPEVVADIAPTPAEPATIASPARAPEYLEAPVAASEASEPPAPTVQPSIPSSIEPAPATPPEATVPLSASTGAAAMEETPSVVEHQIPAASDEPEIAANPAPPAAESNRGLQGQAQYFWAGGIGVGLAALIGIFTIRRKTGPARSSLISRSISVRKPQR